MHLTESAFEEISFLSCLGLPMLLTPLLYQVYLKGCQFQAWCGVIDRSMVFMMNVNESTAIQMLGDIALMFLIT